MAALIGDGTAGLQPPTRYRSVILTADQLIAEIETLFGTCLARTEPTVLPEPDHTPWASGPGGAAQ